MSVDPYAAKLLILFERVQLFTYMLRKLNRQVSTFLLIIYLYPLRYQKKKAEMNQLLLIQVGCIPLQFQLISVGLF